MNRLIATGLALTMATAAAGCARPENTKPGVEGWTISDTWVNTEEGQRLLGNGTLVLVRCQQNKPDGSGRVLGGKVLSGTYEGVEFVDLERSEFEPAPNDPYGADKQNPPQDPTGPLDHC